MDDIPGFRIPADGAADGGGRLSGLGGIDKPVTADNINMQRYIWRCDIQCDSALSACTCLVTVLIKRRHASMYFARRDQIMGIDLDRPTPIRSNQRLIRVAIDRHGDDIAGVNIQPGCPANHGFLLGGLIHIDDVITRNHIDSDTGFWQWLRGRWGDGIIAAVIQFWS